MYKLFLFTGGVYKFDEFKEAVEDVGGMVLKKDLFHKRRGSYFVAEEVQVTVIIPSEDEKGIKSLVDEIKGHLEELYLENLDKKDMLTYLSIYDALNKSRGWMTSEDLKDVMECPCPAQLCNGEELEECIQEQIKESLEKFSDEDMLLTRKKKENREYKLQES